jgi:hypothetical protein
MSAAMPGPKVFPATATAREEKRISSILLMGILKVAAIMQMAVKRAAIVSVRMFFNPDKI